MNILSVLKSELIDRIFNKHTPVGISQLIVGIVLMNAGFSEKFIEVAMSYNWDFVERALKEWHTGIQISAVFFIALGGFYVIRVDLDKRKSIKMEQEVKASETETTIGKNKVEQKKSILEGLNLDIAILDKKRELKCKLKLYEEENNNEA